MLVDGSHGRRRRRRHGADLATLIRAVWIGKSGRTAISPQSGCFIQPSCVSLTSRIVVAAKRV